MPGRNRFDTDLLSELAIRATAIEKFYSWRIIWAGPERRAMASQVAALPIAASISLESNELPPQPSRRAKSSHKKTFSQDYRHVQNLVLYLPPK
jgi:hypothetical protein